MKRGRIALTVAILVLGSVGAAEALEWESYAALSAVVRPNPPEGSTSNLTARGVHGVRIKQIGVEDLIFPIRFKIVDGELRRNGAVMRYCGSNWIWAKNQLNAACLTAYREQDCVSAFWESSSYGQLEFHPKGGFKLGTAGPTWVACGACVRPGMH